MMTQEELFEYRFRYAANAFLFELYKREGGTEPRKYVEEHVLPVPKDKLVAGTEYPGYCRNAIRATWDGQKFHYKYYKCGFLYETTINHYEDDDKPGIDVFVPVVVV